MIPSYMCCTCGADVVPNKGGGFLWFSSWVKFAFCKQCWGMGNARWFPGAHKLARKLLSIGGYLPEIQYPDVRALLGEVINSVDEIYKERAILQRMRESGEIVYDHDSDDPLSTLPPPPRTADERELDSNGRLGSPPEPLPIASAPADECD